MYHFESLDCRNVHKGDGGEVQDQAVEVHPGNIDVHWKLQLRRNDLDNAELGQLVLLPAALVPLVNQIPYPGLFEGDRRLGFCFVLLLFLQKDDECSHQQSTESSRSVSSHLCDVIIAPIHEFSDFPESFVPLLQNFLGIKSNLEQPGVAIRSIQPHPTCEKRRAVRTASLSLSLKNSMLAKKIGEGILKIFTPFGSYIWGEGGGGGEKEI